jgi:Tfp pilus assembly protein PilN
MKPVNLLPQEARRAQASGERSGSAYVIVGVLGALLLMLVGYVLVSNQVTSKSNDAATAEAKATALEQQAAQKDAFTDFASIKEQRLLSVSSIAETRFDWERFMRELGRIMPARSWIQTADASTTGDAAGSTADPAATAAIDGAGPTANLVGCVPGQQDTATMMVRLRQLFRVSDVELKESAVESSSGTAGETTIDNCGAFYKFDITVKFSPTPPASEAPRGATRVPASLGGGS